MTATDVLEQLAFRHEWLRRRDIAFNHLDKRLQYVAEHVPACRSVRGASSIGAFPCVTEEDLRKNFSLYVSGEFPLDARSLSGPIHKKVAALRDGASYYSNTLGSIERVFEMYSSQLNKSYVDTPIFTWVTAGPTPNCSVVHMHLNFGLVRKWSIGTDNSRADDLIQRLAASPPLVLAGSVGALVRVEAFWRDSQDAREPQLVLYTGGGVDEVTIERFHDLFGAPVVHAYTRPECGLVALECIESGSLHVMRDTTHVEVITADGEIAPEGCGELLITVLDNHHFGLVRYLTGETADLLFCECSCGYVGPTISNWRCDGFHSWDDQVIA